MSRTDEVPAGSVQPDNEIAPESAQPDMVSSRTGLLTVGSFALAALEAVCVFFIGLSKLGILIGVAAFMSAEIASPFHADRIRVPLLGLASTGAVVNLFILWNAHRLRSAPAAGWRKRPLSASQRRRIVFLVTLSVVTILLVVGEFWIHPIGER